jgi:polysaccharide biosynthesis transport protein
MKDLKGLGPLDFIQIFWRRKWYALISFMLVGGGIVFYALHTPQIYRSDSRILVESATVGSDYVVPSDRSSPEDKISAIRQQVQSRSFIEGIIEELQLFGYGSNKQFSMDAAVVGVSSNTQVISTSRNTFTISYSSTNPRFSQMIVKRMVESVIQSNSSERKAKALETDQFVDQQLRQTESELIKQEDKITQFKKAHLGELPEQSNANLSALSGLHAQLAAAESAIQHVRDQQKILELRADEEKRINSLTRTIFTPSPTSGSEPAPKAIPGVNPQLSAKQAELAALSAKYTPNHPDVARVAREIEEIKRQIAQRMDQAEGAGRKELTPLSEGEKKASAGETEISSADVAQEIQSAELKMEAESLKNEIAKREREKESILAQVKLIQGRLNLAPALEQELLNLSRERETLRQQYGNLQSKKFQAQLTANLETNKNSDTYKIIDEANLPERPSFPDRQQIIWTGLLVAAFVGVGVAFVREILDSTIGNEQEAATVFKLPILASISEIPKERRGTTGRNRTAA